ncbi:MAG: phosphotransferase [Candidatus Sulfotelmatobacter sp.]
MYRLPSAGGERFVVAKAARTLSPAIENALRTEFSALEEVESRAGNTLGSSVPRPLLFLEREGMLVLSGVEGVSLDSTLRRQANALKGKFSRESMHNVGLLVGAWLRQFHDATAAQSEPHHHNNYLRELDSNIYRSRELGLSTATLQKIRDRVEATSRSLAGSIVTAAAAHGDFLPQNILIGRTGAGVVDFGSYWHEAPIYRDLAHLSAYLALLANRTAYDRGAIESLKRGFFTSYGGKVDADLLRIYEVNATLRIINDRSSVLTPGRSMRIERWLMSLSAVAVATR